MGAFLLPETPTAGARPLPAAPTPELAGSKELLKPDEAAAILDVASTFAGWSAMAFGTKLTVGNDLASVITQSCGPSAIVIGHLTHRRNGSTL